MEAKLYGQNKGGMSINGIIKDYYAYAGENISAGDLVEYVNGVAGETDYGESIDTQLSTTTYTGSSISAVALDESRVFIAHSYSSALKLYGMVCTVNGATITLGADTALNNSNGTSEGFSLGLLPNGNVFIAHKNNSNYLYGMIVTINGTTISVATDTQLTTTSAYTVSTSTLVLPNGDVFIAHSYGDNNYLYGIVCTIDGTTITKGTDTALVSSTNAGITISTCLLPNGNVFIAHSYGSNYSLRGIVVSINGTTFTKGSDTPISNNTNDGKVISTCLLPNGKIFIAYSSGSSYYLYGIVCSISGNGITQHSGVVISNSTNAGSTISTCLLPNGNVFIAHSYGSKYYLYGMVVTIDGTAITKGTDTQLSTIAQTGLEMPTIDLLNGNVFIAHNYSSDNYLYAQIFGIDYENNIPTNHISITEYETQLRKVTTAQFDGIAKTSGEGGDDTGHKDVVSIWTLGATQEFTMADGNTLCDSNGDIFLVREG